MHTSVRTLTSCSRTGLITRAWIQFPHTRGLTKHLWTRSPDTIDELFASTALSFDLGVTKLAFEGMGTPGARFPKLLAEGIERLSTNLEELTLREYEKVESENFRLSTLVPKLSALDISMPCDDPERFYGLRDLDLLEVAFKIPPDEADDDGTAENTSLGRTAQVVKHCLPTLEYITMFWGGCNCCTSAPMNKRLASLFDAPVGPNLRSFTLDNFQLFSTTRSYPLPDILRALSASPKLRNIYFFSLGRFAPPLDFEEQWKDLRIESVEKLSMASHYSEQTQYRGMLTDVSSYLHFRLQMLTHASLEQRILSDPSCIFSKSSHPFEALRCFTHSTRRTTTHGPVSKHSSQQPLQTNSRLSLLPCRY